jgi:hypothetical protein
VVDEVDALLQALLPYMKDGVRSELPNNIVEDIMKISKPVKDDLNKLQKVVSDRYMASRWTWYDLSTQELRATMGTLSTNKDRLGECLKELLKNPATHQSLDFKPQQKGLCILSLGMSCDAIESEN